MSSSGINRTGTVQPAEGRTMLNSSSFLPFFVNGAT